MRARSVARAASAPADHRTRTGQERSARTEARILEAAMKVFAEQGPDAPVIDDFVRAADISRGTFYNHFDSVPQLLAATSLWRTGEVLVDIERRLAGLKGPTLRFGVGLRMFLAHAQHDRAWSQFVARVWKVGGLELPARDLDEGLRLGHFRVASREAAHDIVFGGVREALQRIGAGRVAKSFGEDVTRVVLQALGADGRRIQAVLSRALPELHEPTPLRPGSGAPR